MLELKHISFETILPVWSEYLWPGRTSIIEQCSAIEYNSLPYTYNIDYMACKPTFFGLFDGAELVGVNSGHATEKSYRSRGLYVFEKYRGLGYGIILLEETVNFAKKEGYEFVWSIPRKSSFSTYFKTGFTLSSEWFGTETSEYNAYAINSIK